MKKILLLLAVLIILILFVTNSLAGPGSCPNGQEFCYTARHKITGDIACFPGKASNTEPGNGWIPVGEGCEESKIAATEAPAPTLTALPIIFPTTTPIVFLATPTPVLTEEEREEAAFGIVNKQGIFATATTVCEPGNCCDRIVEQLTQLNVWQATQAAAAAAQLVECRK